MEVEWEEEDSSGSLSSSEEEKRRNVSSGARRTWFRFLEHWKKKRERHSQRLSRDWRGSKAADSRFEVFHELLHLPAVWRRRREGGEEGGEDVKKNSGWWGEGTARSERTD